MTMEKAMSILGVTKDDSLKDVKRKYFEQVKRNHPDLSTDARAKERMQNINLAYDYIKKHYNEIKSVHSRTKVNAQVHTEAKSPKIELCRIYIQLYNVNIKPENLLLMYREFSTGPLVNFLKNDFSQIANYANMIKDGADVYELYRATKERIGDNLSCEKFISILKSCVPYNGQEFNGNFYGNNGYRANSYRNVSDDFGCGSCCYRNCYRENYDFSQRTSECNKSEMESNRCEDTNKRVDTNKKDDSNKRVDASKKSPHLEWNDYHNINLWNYYDRVNRWRDTMEATGDYEGWSL